MGPRSACADQDSRPLAAFLPLFRLSAEVTNVNSGRAPLQCVLSLVAGFACGVTVAYLTDPTTGRRRRARLRARVPSIMRRSERRLARAGRHAAANATGRLSRALHPRPGPAADDHALVDRVESELFLHHGRYKGLINMDAQDGTVTLRGQLQSQREIAELVRAVKTVGGVVDVRNLLHLQATPAPNKIGSITAGIAEPARVQSQPG